ncbi:MAG: hypothetical protein V4454_01275 [Pseudomonadota bacterium]
MSSLAANSQNNMPDHKDCKLPLHHSEECDRVFKEGVKNYIESLSLEKRLQMDFCIKAFLLNAWLVMIRHQGVQSLPPSLQISFKEQCELEQDVERMFKEIHNYPENIAMRKEAEERRIAAREKFSHL